METWQAALVVIGCIGGLLAIIEFISTRGTWKGSIESKVKILTDCMTTYPPAKMYTMLETLWEVYVKDALVHRPDLATHSSPFELKPDAAGKIPPDIKEKLDKLREQHKEDIVTGFTVVHHLGFDTIEKTSKKMGYGVQETIAVLSTYLENYSNNHKPSVS